MFEDADKHVNHLMSNLPRDPCHYAPHNRLGQLQGVLEIRGRGLIRLILGSRSWPHETNSH